MITLVCSGGKCGSKHTKTAQHIRHAPIKNPIESSATILPIEYITAKSLIFPAQSFIVDRKLISMPMPKQAPNPCSRCMKVSSQQGQGLSPKPIALAPIVNATLSEDPEELPANKEDIDILEL